MKTRFLRVGRLLTALVLAAFLPGCLDKSAQPAANGGEKPLTKSITKNTENDPPPGVTRASAESAPTPVAALSSEAAPTAGPALPKLSPGLAEVIRLAQAQVGESVLLAYIDKAAFEFNPSLEEVLYLHDVGISEPVLTALLHRSKVQADAMAKLAEAEAALTKNMAVPKTAVPVLNPMPSIAPQQPATVVEPDAAQIVVQPVIYTQPVVISQPVYYNELSPYGTWIEVGDYGRCWQPTVAVVDLSWRPYYHRGRWLDTDRGWYWQSDYSWGSTPFHYGRWHQDRSCGWVWVPGDTWAPAWVSWRSSNAYCGWAPLPPAARFGAGVGFSFNNSRVGANFEFGLTSSHYTFLPINRFCDSTPYRHYVPQAQVNTIYQQTTIVNNYITGNNNTVINRGVDHKAVVAASPVEIRKVSIRDATGERAQHIRPDRLVQEGDSIAIYRHQVASLTPTATGGTAKPESLSTAKLPGKREPFTNGESIRKPAVESGPTIGRPSITPNITPSIPVVASTQHAPNTPIVPLVSTTPKTVTVPHLKPAVTISTTETVSASPTINLPAATAPQAPSTLQTPKLSSPTTQPQPTVPSTSQPGGRNSNQPEHFPRPEVQRPAPPARSNFQAPIPSAPATQSQPAVVAPQQSKPAASHPQPTPPPQRTGDDPKRNR